MNSDIDLRILDDSDFKPIAPPKYRKMLWYIYTYDYFKLNKITTKYKYLISNFVIYVCK